MVANICESDIKVEKDGNETKITDIGTHHLRPFRLLVSLTVQVTFARTVHVAERDCPYMHACAELFKSVAPSVVTHSMHDAPSASQGSDGSHCKFIGEKRSS